MDKSHEILRRALDLSLAIYRLTERLPKGEILVWQLKRLGNDAIGDLVEGNLDNCQKKISLLLIYFEIGQAQNWVREINWLVLRNEYQKLSSQIIELAGESKKEPQPIEKEGKAETIDIASHNIKKQEIKTARPSKIFNTRQEMIIERMKTVSFLKMSELSSLFKDLASERTLRNDLQILLKNGVLNKSGTNKTTQYFLNRQ